METGWNYSDLTHIAKTYGGPELFVSAITNQSEIKGIKKGMAIGVVAMMSLGAIAGGVAIAYRKVKERRERKEAEVMEKCIREVIRMRLEEKAKEKNETEVDTLDNCSE